MGYQRKRKLINVVFDGDSPYAGLVVQLRGLSIGEYLSIVGMGEVDRSSISEGLTMMAAALISWNLEDEDGRPVPATAEAVRGEDQDMVISIFNGWLDALNGKVKENDPLSESSPSGGPSLEASIPMAVPSGSLAS